MLSFGGWIWDLDRQRIEVGLMPDTKNSTIKDQRRESMRGMEKQGLNQS